MFTRRSVLMATAISGCCPFAVGGRSWADSYPQRPVKIVVAGLPGVPFDLLARAIADKLSVTFKQPFVVENRPGAAGNLGAEAVARSAPDGHILLMSLSSTFTVNPSLYKKLPFDPTADFRFLTLAARAPNMLVVHPSVPINSLSEFVAYAKKEPIAYAHGGPGTPGHLCMEYFRLLAGFQTMPVAYRGNTQLSADLAAGQIKFGFVGTGGIIQHVRAGRLKGLAISSRERSPLAPEVPSISELGYPEFEFNAYFPLSVPAGTPEEVIALLEGEVRDALRSSDLQERFVPLDMAIVASTGAEAKTRIESEAKLWAKVVKEADMHVD
jgi:tripartite-type tricarboxylate transporter receptor subunit TctC